MTTMRIVKRILLRRSETLKMFFRFDSTEVLLFVGSTSRRG